MQLAGVRLLLIDGPNLIRRIHAAIPTGDKQQIIDNTVKRGARENGPTVGAYFLYCIFNRMIQAVSKNRLTRWYSKENTLRRWVHFHEPLF